MQWVIHQNLDTINKSFIFTVPRCIESGIKNEIEMTSSIVLVSVYDIAAKNDELTKLTLRSEVLKKNSLE